jgi:drug/metabolite transporter superfamily protein YnfA
MCAAIFANIETFSEYCEPMIDPKQNEFEKAAAEEVHGGIFSDLWGFLKQNKKWWLLPILVMLLLFGLLIFLSGTGLAPFIYTLF